MKEFKTIMSYNRKIFENEVDVALKSGWVIIKIHSSWLLEAYLTREIELK